MNKPQIAVSIVTYNSKDIFDTLENFSSQILNNFPVKIYIFDNNSSEEYKEKLAEYKSEQIDIHFNGENKGFGYGHNKIANEISEEYLLLCNPDISVDKENFGKMFEYLVSHEDVMVAPKVLYPTGEVQYLFRRKLDVFDYILRFVPFNFVKKIFHKRLAYFECRDLSEDRQEVLFASGCFMLLRTSDYLSVDGFDERFFMYFEDNDFCQKLRINHKKIMYLPDAHVIHCYGKESHKSSKVFKIFIKSMTQYFNKWGWKFF